MADYKYICKSEDKNVADKKYVVLRYAKQYALKHKTDIEDLVTGEILHYDDIKNEFDTAVNDCVDEIKDVHEEVKEDVTKCIEKEREEIKDAIEDRVESISNKLDDTVDYAEEKTNKLFGIIRKFIERIKSIFRR